MSLRTRLAVTAALVIVPLSLTLLYVDASARHQAAERILIELASARLTEEREQCELAPAQWGGTIGPPRGPRGRPPPFPEGVRRRPRPAILFAYGPNFQSQNPAAPALPLALRTAVADAEVGSEESLWPSEEIDVLVRTPWRSGPCAMVLAHGTTGQWGALLPETQVWVLPMLVVVATFLLAMGPIVARIRRLTAAVQLSASESYEQALPSFGGDEIGQLGRAFDAAGREIRARLAERARREQALREFIANTTHDVMIPLTVLQGQLSTLRQRAADDPAERELVASAMDEAHYMGSLIHNLAAVARLDMAERELQRTRVDLNELVIRVVARHRPIAQQQGIELESATPAQSLHAHADLTLLEQAVSNVTYNAIRHNARGGHAAVILESVAPDRFLLKVLDDGPGVEPAELARMIERGTRSNEARTRVPEGQGLGLHIAYRAIELHGYALQLRRGDPSGLIVEIEGPLG